ncbi:MAG: hypothetical protein Q4A70_04020 [Candidatus Saccharibacteria bacterium]|nr:hypothetical protein [Candidatus Saccharibacteria bacterium]
MKVQDYLRGKVTKPANAHPWPHEERVANILALAGHAVEFIPDGTIGTADIYLDGIIYEIKSPKTRNTNTIEHRLKDAIRNQSSNLIIDSFRLKGMPDSVLQNWLIERCRKQPQIKRMLFVNKKGQIVDIKALV